MQTVAVIGLSCAGLPLPHASTVVAAVALVGTGLDGAAWHLIASVRLILRGAAKASPGGSPSALLLRSKIVLTWLRNLHLLRSLRSTTGNGGLNRALQERPELLGVAVWPYIHAGWCFEQKVHAVEDHYRQVARIASRLDLSVSESLLVASFEDIRPGLRLVLDRAQWFMREGELVLNIFTLEQRLFSVAFSLGLDGERSVVRIGGLQGVRDENILDVYRELTKSLHGLRPRDFLLDALKSLCSTLGINTILAIADANRQHRHAYFGAGKSQHLEGDYDEVWSEHGGVLRESGFFEFHSQIECRSIEDIPSKKRSMYRKRYEFLESLGARIAASCADGSVSPVSNLVYRSAPHSDAGAASSPAMARSKTPAPQPDLE